MGQELASLPDQSDELVRRLAKAEQREAAAREKLEAHVEELAETRRIARTEADVLRQELRALKELDRSHDEAFEARVAALESAKVAAEQAVTDVERSMVKLEKRASKAERERARAERRLQAVPARFDPEDPIEIARHLDAIAKAARRIVQGVRPEPAREEEPAEPESPFRLPAGARPDSSNSIEWLVKQPRPFTAVVDGYNLTHRLFPDDPVSAVSRDALNEHLSRFKLVARTPVQVIVVYDSGINPDIQDEPGPGGVFVRFTQAGRSADEEIRGLVSSMDEAAIVISSDREVREGVTGPKLIGLWGEALIEWIKKR